MLAPFLLYSILFLLYFGDLQLCVCVHVLSGSNVAKPGIWPDGIFSRIAE